MAAPTPNFTSVERTPCGAFVPFPVDVRNHGTLFNGLVNGSAIRRAQGSRGLGRVATAFLRMSLSVYDGAASGPKPRAGRAGANARLLARESFGRSTRTRSHDCHLANGSAVRDDFTLGW